jgi:hypothetical protein
MCVYVCSVDTVLVKGRREREREGGKGKEETRRGEGLYKWERDLPD